VTLLEFTRTVLVNQVYASSGSRLGVWGEDKVPVVVDRINRMKLALTFMS